MLQCSINSASKTGILEWPVTPYGKNMSVNISARNGLQSVRQQASTGTNDDVLPDEPLAAQINDILFQIQTVKVNLDTKISLNHLEMARLFNLSIAIPAKNTCSRFYAKTCLHNSDQPGLVAQKP